MDQQVPEPARPTRAGLVSRFARRAKYDRAARDAIRPNVAQGTGPDASAPATEHTDSAKLHKIPQG